MKLKRHEKIIELIEQYDIETQDELAELLRKEGFDVTQATVSRDIRKLALSKVPGKNALDHRIVEAVVHRYGKEWSPEIRASEPSGSPDGRKVRGNLKGSICFHGSGAEYSGDQDRVRYGHGCCHSP